MLRTRTMNSLAALVAAGVTLVAVPAEAQQREGLYDQGWAAPARVPVYRVPVQYQRYYPARWYGTPGSTLEGYAPMTYVPTDTMQLGYYHQRVPAWQPRPGMLPAPPRPDQWVMREREFANPPMIYNMSYWQWKHRLKHGRPTPGYTHGPAVTPYGYGYGGYVVPADGEPQELPTPAGDAEGSEAEGGDAEVTDKTALAPFLTR